MNKKLIIIAVLAVVALFFIFDLHVLLTLEGLRGSLENITDWRSDNPLLFASIFFVFYVAVTALSLPGAAVMTLAAGALFGILVGVLLVSFASSIGATLAFLFARYLLRDAVQTRFGDRLNTINDGVQREGPFYLFTLRLVPIFPFFLINVVMGLTKLRVTTFYWVSQVGMLAGTIVYVNAGTQLAQIEQMGDIVSPGLLISFALLGIFPWVGRFLVSIFRQRQVYGKWEKPVRFDRNMIVIGGGAGGLVTAYIAAAVKAKVTLVEHHKMGGDCLNYGCVPSKALIKSARVAHTMRHAEAYGLSAATPSFSFKKVMQRVHDIIAAIEPHDSIERYTKLGVEVLTGYAKLLDPWTVEITAADGTVQRLTARSIVLATGAEPFVPPLPVIESSNMVTSDTLWETCLKRDTAPKSMVVLGGGPIGCELAQSFARLGVRVTQVEMAPRLLVRESEKVSDAIKKALEADGVTVLTDHQAVSCLPVGAEGVPIVSADPAEHHVLMVKHEGKEKAIPYEVLLCAVGRKARLTGFGLEKLGIPVDRTITTNEYLETLYPNIYAAGDVAGPYQFTHTAAHQAWYAAVNGLFAPLKKFKVDYRVIPWVTFTDPEVARVGISAAEAKEKGIAFEVTTYGLDDLDRAITESAAEGYIEVLTPPGKDRILGVTIVGDHAGELLAEFVLAMKHGLGLNKILGTIHAYPTWAEACKYTAGEWKRANAPEKILAWLERFHAWRRGEAKQQPASSSDQHSVPPPQPSQPPSSSASTSGGA